MIIQKLRLEKGWSQQQLAQMSGLSTRTIQRIESGKKPSVESVKSLSAVFEIDFTMLNQTFLNHTSQEASQEAVSQESFKETHTMHTPKTTELNKQTDYSQNSLPILTLTKEEEKAYEKVRDIKDFYNSMIQFVVVMSFLLVLNLVVSPDYLWVKWVFLGWGLGMVIYAVQVFDLLNPFDAEWEQRQVNKYLNKK